MQRKGEAVPLRRDLTRTRTRTRTRTLALTVGLPLALATTPSQVLLRGNPLALATAPSQVLLRGNLRRLSTMAARLHLAWGPQLTRLPAHAYPAFLRGEVHAHTPTLNPKP